MKKIYSLIAVMLFCTALTAVYAQNVNVNATSGVGSASYATLKSAFDAINLGTHTGALTISIAGNTIETASAVLNENGAGASYTSVVIMPSGNAARTISGSVAGPLIDLNGADYVTIDGLNTSGNTLTISNADPGVSSTIRLASDASHNIITHCTIRGSGSGATGIVFFDSAFLTGNDGNKISNCNITAEGANFPTNAIYSSGTSEAIANDNDSLVANTISDYFNDTTSTSGILLTATGNTAWTIMNNKLFQTASRIYTVAQTHYGINILSGDGYTITGNTVGYANANGTGTTNIIGNTVTPTGTFPTAYTSSGTANATRYVAIYGAFAAMTTSSIQDNTIGGLALYTSSGATTSGGILCGIYVASGSADIGTTTGNIIGAVNGPASIYASSSTVSGTVVGIYANSSLAINIRNNFMGRIDVSGRTSATTGSFVGIDVVGGANYVISNNTIGADSVNNIRTGYLYDGTNLTNRYAPTPAATGSSLMIGIRSASTGNSLQIYNNIIRGFLAAGSSTAVSGIVTSGAMTGTTPLVLVDSNQIGTTNANWVYYPNTAGGALSGISVTNTIATTHTIRKNNITGIIHATTSSGVHNYIVLSGATAADNISTISGNTFTNLSVSSTGPANFISHNYSLDTTGSLTIENNSIVTAFNRSGASGTVSCLYTASTGSNAASGLTVRGNNFSNITLAGSSTFNGTNNPDVCIKNYENNKFINITGGTSPVIIFNVSGGPSATFTNNTIGNIRGKSTVSGFLSGSATTSLTIDGDTIYGLTSSGASSTVVGITSSSASISISNCSIYDLSSTGTTSPIVNGIAITGGTSAAVYKNKIYDLEVSSALTPTAGAVNGILISGGTAVNAYYNLVGNLTAPLASSPDVIRGISINSAVQNANIKIYYNTIHIAATTTGPNFGTTGIYHLANTTATTGRLYLRNNIISNASVAAGTGKVVSFRRSSGAANMLNNYDGTSNNNLFYAGAPGAANLIYDDGISSTAVLTAYQNGVFTAGTIAGRDSLSVSGMPDWLSTAGADADFLKINETIATPAESGALEIAGYTSDFDSAARTGYPLPSQVNGGGTAPDIGAFEFDGIPAALMNYVSTTSQQISDNTYRGAINQLIVKMEVVTSGSSSPLSVASFVINANGTTNVSDILNAKIYYTAGINNFDTSKLFGSFIFPTTTNFIVNGNQQLSEGNNYFWLVYDISPTAVPNNVVDGEYVSVFVNSTSRTPTVSAPAGNKIIIGPISGNYNIGAAQLSPNYTTISAAISDMNLRGISGAVVFNLMDNAYPSENYPILIDSIVGSSSVNTITIRPDASVTSMINLTGISPGGIFNLSGVNYLTIDGRIGGTGSTNMLTIENTSTGTTAYTVQFVNESSNNTIKYCNIRGASASASTGTIVFGLTTGNNGNDNDSVFNCNIYDASTGTPATAIYAVGTTTNPLRANDHNTVVSCNIYDFYNPTVGIKGIVLGNGNNGWQITGNSFYQTSARSSTTGSAQVSFINISNSNNTEGFNVSNNYFGGTAPNATGGLCSFTSPNWDLRLVVLTTSISASANEIQGNTIRNISFVSTFSSTQLSLLQSSGNANIGTVSPNLLGDTSISGSITFSGGLFSSFSALYIGGPGSGVNSGIINAKNNIVSGITANGSTSFRAITVATAAGVTFNISDNLIGSRNTANSITVSTNATSYGIYASVAAGRQVIANNTITNINLTGAVSTAAFAAIATSTLSNGVFEITGNNISGITTNSTAISTTVPSICGISHSTTTAGGVRIAKNSIYNFNSVAVSESVVIAGIFYSGSTSGRDTIEKNSVYGFGLATTSTTASIWGIKLITGSLIRLVNNEVSLGSDFANNSLTGGYAIYGISETTGANSYYHNSVRISGTDVDNSSSTYAFHSISSTPGLRNIINNSFSNERSFSTVPASTGNYAAIIVGEISGGAIADLNCNFNLYYAPGTGGVDIRNDSIGVEYTLATWKTATPALDQSSISVNPEYNSLHMLLPFSTTPLTTGTFLSGIVDDDITGASRFSYRIGAYENTGDLSAPDIAINLTNTSSTANRTVTATIEDLSGVDIAPGSIPRLYFKKSTNDDVLGANTHTVNGWKWVEASNTTSPFTFTMDYGLLQGDPIGLGDVIQYFIVAQDIASPAKNIGASAQYSGFAATTVNTVTSAPSNPNSFKIIGSWDTSYAIGGTMAGPSIGCTYVSLNEAFADVTPNSIKSIYVTNAGTGYTTASVTFTGGDGTGLAATAVIISGAIAHINITNNGTGYSVAPTVIITGNGSGAIAIANVSSGRELLAPVKLELTATYISTLEDVFPITIKSIQGSGLSNTLTIKPATGTTAAIVGANNSKPLIKLLGADYIIIDGSNSGGTDKSLTINNTGTINGAAIAFESIGIDGAAYNTIKNCNLTVAVGTTAGTSYGIHFGGTALGSAGANFDFNTILNNNINGASVGVFTYGSSGTSNGGNDSIAIIGNTISGTFGALTSAGIKLSGSLNCFVNKNTIDIESSSTTMPVGISIETNTVSTLVSGNTITKVLGTSTSGRGARGIVIGTGIASSDITIVNNIVSGVNGTNSTAFGTLSSGIAIGGSSTISIVTGGIKVYHNTVNMSGDYSNTESSLTTGVYVGSGASNIDIQNNIITNSANNITNAFSKCYALCSDIGDTAFTTINYNDYAVAGVQGVLGYIGGDQVSLSDLQTATAQDVNSVSIDPQYASTTDLTPTICLINNAGTPLASVPTDLNGATRSTTTPDIGAIEFTATGYTWTGTISTDWNNIFNWNCPITTTATTNVSIPADAVNMPVITDAQLVHNIAIDSGASLILNNTSSVLGVYGNIANDGTFTNTFGKVAFKGSNVQTIPAGVYAKLEVNNVANVNLIGSVSLTDSLILTNGKIILNGNNLILGNAAFASAGSATTYISTNGTGTVTANNIGSGGKATTIILPIGNSSYNPVSLLNTGIADDYTVWVIDSVTGTYTGSTPTGAKYTSGAVNRTWIINEGLAGGSNATLIFGWNAADELPGFSRAASYVASNTGTSWLNNSPSVALGANPYTQSRSGVTSFSPFAIGSGSALPVKLLSFNGRRQKQTVDLTWTTASEINSNSFVVERSTDHKTWSTIGKVKANGNTSSLSNYQLNDANAFVNGKTVFYRLRIVDNDGSFTYSESVVIHLQEMEKGTSVVFPNPFTDAAYAAFTLSGSTQVKIIIIDITGKLLSEDVLQLSKGDHQIPLNTAELKPGIYFATIVQNGMSIVHKIIKQ